MATIFCMVALEAQIKKPMVNVPGGSELKLTTDLNLETIKGHIRNKTFCYTLHLSSTAIVPPKHPQPLKALDAYYSSTNYVIVERDYLRSNGLLLRSDTGFNRNAGNTYEVLIYPERADKRNVDVNRVKLTWRSPERGLNTFHLKNVSVSYKSYGILIIGDYEIDGLVFGVTLALTPGSCII